MKKVLSLTLGIAMVAASLVGCKAGSSTAITVLSREEGSGTRGAFVELLEVEKEVNGEMVDSIVETAEITNSTSVMLTTVKGNESAIGYVSLGSLNDTVKAVKIDGAEPTAAAAKNGSYKLSRPFNLVVKGEASPLAADFMGFILSTQGQSVVEKAGYVPLETEKSYVKKTASGTLKIGGSSSVAPVMQKLKEAYEKLNPDITIEIQESDSTTGINSVAEGSFQIGMSSRGLTAEEEKKGLTSTVIATDGIAVIVNAKNTVESLSSQQVKEIYMGEITDWAELK